MPRALLRRHAAAGDTFGVLDKGRTVNSTESKLLQEFIDGTERLKRDIGYNPTYFMQMVTDLGPVQASKQLIHSKNPSDGFTKLWETARLDMTVEAISLLPWYDDLFDDE